MPYDPQRRNGWARGLVHFHTQFSDGWASVLNAGEIAIRLGYDFLVVTDHLRNLKFFTHKTLEQYVEACDEATVRLGIPVIPGGEMEVHWNDPITTDFSEAHTLTFNIRPLVAAGEFDWTTPGTDPFSHWRDSQGKSKTILAVQEMLLRHNLPPVAAHQFAHSVVGKDPNKQPDFRYDLAVFPTARYFDFFYSGAVDLIHEMEDILLVARYATTSQRSIKGIYSGCDFHVGPQIGWPPIAHLTESIGVLGSAYRWLFKTLAAAYLRSKGDAEAAPFPWFADEQLSHATYLFLGDQPCSEAVILDALRDGRTAVSRGHIEFLNLEPMPSFSVVHQTPVHIHLNLPVSYSEPRPRSAIVFRDGQIAHWEPYSVVEPSLQFTYVDLHAPAGLHAYQVYVPSKFLSSPMIFTD